MNRYFLLKQKDLEYKIPYSELESDNDFEDLPSFLPFIYIDIFEVNDKDVKRASEKYIGQIIKKINKNQETNMSLPQETIDAITHQFNK